MSNIFATTADALQNQLDYAIRFFGAATPFLTSLALFVALLILLLRHRPPRGEPPDAPPRTEEERRDRIVELVEKLMRQIL